MNRKTPKARGKFNELLSILKRKNTVRAFLSALVFSIITPIFLLVVHFSGIFGAYSRPLKIWLAVIETFNVLMAAAGFYIVSHNDTDWQKDYYLTVYSGVLISFSIVGGIGLAATGSIILYMVAAFYFIAVAALVPKERIICQGIMLAGSIIPAIASGVAVLHTLQLVAFELGAVFLSQIVQGYIVEIERLNVRLRDKTISSEKDPLTGLTNRRGLERKTSVLWPYCQRNGVMVGMIEMDIDFFKKYNDRFGHPAGDECLRKVAGAIKDSAKRHTDITARTGGEEFVIFIQGMDEKELVDFAMNMRKNIADLQIPHAYAGVSQYVTVSMGIALIDPNVDSMKDLYDTADKALYRAKSNGRNCIVCNGRVYGKLRNGVGSALSI